MSSSIMSLLAAAATYTVRESGSSDPTVVIKEVRTTTTANVKSEPLMTAGKAGKGRKVQARSTGEQAAPTVSGEKREGGLLLLKPGTYDARSFLAAYRAAGVRERDNGGITVKVVDQSLIHNDQIQAMSGFKGYNYGESFGSQETMALFYAKRETVGIQPGVDKTTANNARRTVVGYVAGMPQPQERLASDLQARQREVVATKAAHFKAAQDMSLTPAQRQEARTAMREGDKLLSLIREQLEGLGLAETSEAPGYAPIGRVLHEV